MHLKRQKIPRTWQIEKKGTKYVVRTMIKNSIPLLLVLRNMLKLAKNRRETRRILASGSIKVNNRVIKEEKYPLLLFDNIKIENENFKLVLKNKKFCLEISKDENKISKIIGKKIMKKGNVQLNLNDGRNYISEKKDTKVNDSVVIDMKENKIKEILPFKEKSRIIFISGKHLGEKGKIEKISGKDIIVELGEKKINAGKKSLMVIN